MPAHHFADRAEVKDIERDGEGNLNISWDIPPKAILKL